MTGQDAVNTAKEFNDRLDFDGVVLTKLDGDTRGGAALSIRSVVQKPIKFIGTGENPKRWMCFIPSVWPIVFWAWAMWFRWWKKRRSNTTKMEARRLHKKIIKNQFDFDDFRAQITQIKKWAISKTWHP